MDKEKVIEALKMIRKACREIPRCENCPLCETDDSGKFLDCGFYNVMMTETIIGDVFDSPFGWRIERLEE